MNTDEVIEYIAGLEEIIKDDPKFLMSAEFREVLKGDFRVFLHFAMKLTFRFTPHRIQLEFADLMQLTGDRILMAMRTFGKSVIDGLFVDWNLLKDENYTILVVSATMKRSMEITGMALAIIKACPFLSHMRPNSTKGDLDGRLAFTVGSRTKVVKEASVVATSITSGNTGSHADLILSDDIEIPKNSGTQQKREDIRKGVDEYEWIKNDGGTELYIGTPQTEDSIYFGLESTGLFTLYRVPAEYPDILDEKQMHCLAPFLLNDLRTDESLVGQPTYPERFNVEELNRGKVKSPGTFSLQMNLDSSMSDEERYPLKLRNFIVMDLSPSEGPRRVAWNTVNPLDDIPSVGMGKDMFYGPAFVDMEPTKYDHIIMGIDPAGGGKDEVGYCVGAGILGNVFITCAGGIQGGHDDSTLKKLCKIMIEYGVKEVRIEKNFGDGIYGKLLASMMGRMGIKAGITQVTAKGQKEVRIIDCLEPAMGSHKIILDTKVARDQVLMSQITMITRERGSLIHDDRVDAMEICISGFTNSMIIDTDKIIADNADQEFLDEIKGYMNLPNKPNRSLFSTSTKGKRKSWI